MQPGDNEQNITAARARIRVWVWLLDKTLTLITSDHVEMSGDGNG